MLLTQRGGTQRANSNFGTQRNICKGGVSPANGDKRGEKLNNSGIIP